MERRHFLSGKNTCGAITRPLPVGLQLRDVVERDHVFGVLGKIDQQDVPSLNRALDPWDQDDTACAGVVEHTVIDELAIVKRERQSIETQLRRAPDELERIVRDVIEGVFPGVQMEIDFQHGVRRLFDTEQSSFRCF